MKQSILVFYIALVLLTSSVLVQSQTITKEITLLAVTERNGEFEGSTASLTLELVPGRGRVFLDTYPLTKFDTQISTRLAKEIACQAAHVDCSQTDFIYTIHSGSPIIGGPSAGAAAAALTVAALLDLPVRNDVAVTGTINSGGIIGPVGGVIPKIKATGNTSIVTVLIPIGERYDNTKNQTVSLVDLAEQDAFLVGESVGVKVIEVSTLHDVVVHLTGYELLSYNTDSYALPEYYETTMKGIGTFMCDRARELKIVSSQLITQSNSSSTNMLQITQLLQDADVLWSRGTDALNATQYYAGASFCFGASIKYQTSIILMSSDYEDKINELEQKLESFSIPSPNTVTDLQTYMLVSERIEETEQLINQTKISLSRNETQSASSSLAYAIERFESAKSWSAFFNKPGQKINAQQNVIQSACSAKISEAEERRQYVGLYFPEELLQRSENLRQAYIEQTDNDYTLCLFYASQAKANYDTVIGSLSIQNNATLLEVLTVKKQVATQAIARQVQEQSFPLMAYSFLEYSESLSNTDPASSLLYAQYALELSDISTYFSNQETQLPPVFTTTQNPFHFWANTLIGFALGLIVASIVFFSERYFVLRK